MGRCYLKVSFLFIVIICMLLLIYVEILLRTVATPECSICRNIKERENANDLHFRLFFEVLTKMASSGRASRLLKAMDLLAKHTTFDYSTVLSKIKLQSVSNGTFQGTFTVDKTMCNMGRSLHGGYIASVIDVLSFYTLVSNSNGRLSLTTSMNVSYIGIAGDGETVNVETKSLKTGNFSVIETYFTNEQGKLLAKGTTSFLTANDKYQGVIKELLDFDVYEN